MMTDREKVIKGLEVCRDMDNPPGYRFTSCDPDCPYHGNGCARRLKEDALALLKEQDAVVRCKDCKAWKQYDDMNLGECGLYPEYNKMGDWFCNFGERKESR